MRVALITPALIAYHAVPISIIYKYQALVRAGHEVTIFTQEIRPRNLPPEIIKKVYILSPELISKFNKGTEAFSETFEKWLDSDIYIFDYPHYYPLIDEIKRVEGLTGFIYHGITPPAYAENATKRSFYTTSILSLNILKEADFGLVYSKYTKDELVNKYRFTAQMIHEIPFGVDTTQFRVNPAKVERKNGLKNKHILSYIGRITPHKNIELLVRALPELLKVDKDILLYLIGDDTGEYAKEKLRLISVAKSLGVEKSVTFLGLVDNLPYYYLTSDVIVSASFHEGCWVPGLEAIAAKKPVVASGNTAIPYTIGKAGLYFDPENKKDYIPKVLEVLKNKKLRGNLTSASERQIKKISIQAHNEAFLQIIKNLPTKENKKSFKKVDPEELLERLKLLIELKNVRVDYHEFSQRKVIGPILSNVRNFMTRHLRRFYIKPLETAQSNFNDAVVESYQAILEYLAEKEKWKIKVQDSPEQKLTPEFFDRGYFVGGDKSNYGDYKQTRGILEILGEMVFSVLHPRSLLDVGCAYGFIPIYLRDKGVESYGIDLSEFAISQGGKSYLMQGDATNLTQFKNKQFEVVMASELMEHLPEKKIDAAIKEAKRVASKYIVYLIAMKGFASHESDHDHDISHVSVKNRKFWLEKFETFRLKRDLAKERILNSDKFSVQMGWSGRFFVLEVPKK